MTRRTFQLHLTTLLFAITVASIAFAMLAPKPKHHLHLFRSAQFNCTDIARAVNHYVDLGEEATIHEFSSMADDDADLSRGFSVNERIGWLCRILFEPGGGSLRPPMFGGLNLPYNSMHTQNWPLYPVAKSGETYCVLSEGYRLAGHAEPVRDYLAYCTSNGSFRTKPVKLIDRTTAIRDVAGIRTSKRWRDIKWSDSGVGFSYTISEPWIWKSIIVQAESIDE